MRVKDIQVGEEYAVRYGVHAKVLETGVERSTYTGKTRRDGVRYQVLAPPHMSGREQIFSSQEVKELWAIKQARMEKREREQAIRDRARAACMTKAKNYQKQFKELGLDHIQVNFSQYGEVDPKDFEMTIRIDNTQIEKLLEILGTPQAQERAVQVAKQPQRSSSALENLFN